MINVESLGEYHYVLGVQVYIYIIQFVIQLK